MKKSYIIHAVCILAAALICGCGSHHEGHNHEGHSHEQESHEGHNHESEGELALCAYNESIELYALYHPLEVGERCLFETFLTALDNFKPIQQATVEASLTVGGKTFALHAEATQTTGVYHLSGTPTAAGKAVLQVTVKTKQGNSSLQVDDLTIFDDAHEAHAYLDAHAINNSNAAHFSKNQSWVIDFSTIAVGQEAFGQSIRTMAQILPSVGDEVTVSAQTSGIVTLTGNRLTEGSSIGNGQTICRIEGAGMSDDNIAVQYANVVAEYERAKSDYELNRKLFSEKLVTVSQLNSSKAVYEGAEAAYRNMQQNFSKGSQQVKAPRTGFIKQLYVTNGQYVEAGQAIAVITQNRTLQLKAEVPASQFDYLANVKSATIRRPNDKRVYTLEEVGGRIKSYGRQTESVAPLIPVTFEINNLSDFLPGTFVEMYLKTVSSEQALTVPNTYLVEEMGNYFVFVQLTHEIFEKREVIIGETDGLKTVIKNGLREGERVVAKGSVIVKLQMASGSVDPHSGHNH